MEEFKTIDSFSKREEYCNKHLIKINSGSSREVFKINEEVALKLAKNEKGIAQNKVECTIWHEKYDNILARVYSYDEEGMYLEMELAKEIILKKVNTLFDFDFKLLKTYIRRKLNKQKIATKIFKILDENEWVQTLVNFVKENNIEI